MMEVVVGGIVGGIAGSVTGGIVSILLYCLKLLVERWQARKDISRKHVEEAHSMAVRFHKAHTQFQLFLRAPTKTDELYIQASNSFANMTAASNELFSMLHWIGDARLQSILLNGVRCTEKKVGGESVFNDEELALLIWTLDTRLVQLLKRYA